MQNLTAVVLCPVSMRFTGFGVCIVCVDICWLMALTRSRSWPLDDMTSHTPMSSPYHESFGRQPRKDSFDRVIPDSHWTRANECAVDQFGPSHEDEELSDSDGSSVEAPSVDDDDSVSTVIPEDEDFAQIRAAIHVEVVTRVFERDGVIPGAETPSSDGHLWPPPTIFQHAACLFHTRVPTN